MASADELSKDFYQALVDGLRDVVFRTDAQGRWQFLNPAWTELTGAPVSESLGRPFLDDVHPDDRERNRAEFNALARGDKTVCQHEVRFLTTSGSWCWVSVNARPVNDTAGELIGVAGTLTDITDRKQLEADLIREKEWAQITLQSLGEGVVTVGSDGRINLINHEAERLLGWANKEALGRPLTDVFRLVDETGQGLDQSIPGDCPEPCPRHCSDSSAWLERFDGSQMAVEWTAAPMSDSGRKDLGCVLVFRDVTAQRTLRQQLAHQATHDDLTGLLNRAALQEAINHQQAASYRGNGRFGLILMDLDQFKVVNDNYGHEVGDRILVKVAERLHQHVREADWLGRWGGEEFLILLPETSGREAVKIAERIRADLDQNPAVPDRIPMAMTVSMGVAAFPEDGSRAPDLLRASDTRLFEAKRGGRNRVESGNGQGGNILPMGSRLHRALNEERILPAYQPIVDLSNDQPVAEEALSRLRDEDGQVLAAGEFIEAASSLQLVHRIDEVLLAKTMERCSSMLVNGQVLDHFVNISTELLRHRDRIDVILDKALQICERCQGLMGEAKPLVIEITEREFLEDTTEVSRILQPLVDYGFRIAVDDFGSGYSSFRYLADLPVSFLKIEGSLVRRATSEPRVQAILHGIRDIAGELELTTIAEMVEDDETADFLREAGIDWAQGFHFGRPQLVGATESA